MKISLIHLLIVPMEVPLNGFLRVIISWSVVNLLCLLCLEIYSLRHAITLESYPHMLYIQTYPDVSVFECFSTSIVMKVTDKSVRTILLILNNLILLSLWARSSRVGLWVSVLKLYMITNNYPPAVQNTWIKYPHPIQNLVLALVVPN